MGPFRRFLSWLDAFHADLTPVPRDPRVPAVAITVAASMTLYQFWRNFVPDSVLWGLSIHPTWANFPLLATEASVRFVLYVIVPLIVARRFGVPLADMGLGLSGLVKHVRRFGWVYIALYVAVAPCIYLASRTAAFQAVYPRYGLASADAAHLFAWWGLYAIIFFAVEFFFRGFLIGMLAPRMGVNAVFVAMMPYTLGHFGKPFAEAAGAIVTGSILGLLALRTRSIWLGWALHCSAAFTMEAFVLGSRHQLPFPFATG